MPKVTDVYHDEDDIVKAIEAIPNKAACGPDGWSALLVKQIKFPLARILGRILFKSLKCGTFPEALKDTFVMGIFKAGSKTEASNYRPIALTSHISKILERVIRKDIVNHLTMHELWDSRQHGSRAGHSTLSQLLAHQDFILQNLEKKVNVDVIYLDFSKAFDRVDHSVLLSKVKALGIQGNLGSWLGTFLLGRRQRVKVGNSFSEPEIILSGVPQGSVLGPIFFLVFILDMGLNSIARALLYVDDSKVSMPVRNEEDVRAFQEEMEIYYSWARCNNMDFNSLKFVVLRYGKDQNLKNDTIYFSDEMAAPIDSLHSHKDLGVMMSADGTFSDHIESVIKKVRKRIGWLCRTFYSRDLQFMRQMYVSVIRPHIDYCSQLWGPGEGPHLDKLEKLQAYFTRLIPSIRSLTYVDRLKALKIQSIQRRFDRYKITYVRKILMKIVPNPGISQRTDESHRLGLTLEIPKVSSKLRSDR